MTIFDNWKQITTLFHAHSNDVLSVLSNDRVSGANLSVFQPLTKLVKINIHNNPHMSLKEIKEEAESERKSVAHRHMFRPVSLLNVIWHTVQCASSGVEFLLSA